MKQRLNISFDQILNETRKDEREYILDLLEHLEDSYRMRGNLFEATVLREAIDHIKAMASTSGGLQIQSHSDGTPI